MNDQGLRDFSLPDLPSALREIAIPPDARAYPLMQSSYMKVGRPALVLRARDEADVRASLIYARTARVASGGAMPFSLRSGGHGISGQSTNTGGIVLDLSLLRRVEVTDPAAAMVRAMPGAVWGEVAAELRKSDLVLTSGNFAGTGVGGLAGSGGFGYFARYQGMTVDRIRGLRLVTADGEIRDLDREREPELFWAARGAAGQIGVVTDFLFEASHLPRTEIIHQECQLLVEDLVSFIVNWGEYMRHAPRELTSFLMVHSHKGSAFVIAQNVWWGTDIQKAQPFLETYLSLGRVVAHSERIVPYPSIVVGGRHPNTGQQDIKMRDGLVDHIDRRTAEAFREMMCSNITAVGELRSAGGAINDIAPDETAYAHRHQEGLVALWCHPVEESLIDQAWAPIHAISTGMYGFYSSDTRASAAALSWPGEVGKRLSAIAGRVDPDGLFTDGLSVRTGGHQTG